MLIRQTCYPFIFYCETIHILTVILSVTSSLNPIICDIDSRHFYIERPTSDQAFQYLINIEIFFKLQELELPLFKHNTKIAARPRKRHSKLIVFKRLTCCLTEKTKFFDDTQHHNDHTVSSNNQIVHWFLIMIFCHIHYFSQADKKLLG